MNCVVMCISGIQGRVIIAAYMRMYICICGAEGKARRRMCASLSEDGYMCRQRKDDGFDKINA